VLFDEKEQKIKPTEEKILDGLKLQVNNLTAGLLF